MNTEDANIAGKALGILLLILGTPTLIMLLVLIGTLAGALVGWVVGLLFSETILGIFAALGLKGFAMWQIGAFLGFVGGFLRSSNVLASLVDVWKKWKA
jgi:hypothetical protein